MLLWATCAEARGVTGEVHRRWCFWMECTADWIPKGEEVLQAKGKTKNKHTLLGTNTSPVPRHFFPQVVYASSREALRYFYRCKSWPIKWTSIFSFQLFEVNIHFDLCRICRENWTLWKKQGLFEDVFSCISYRNMGEVLASHVNLPEFWLNSSDLELSCRQAVGDHAWIFWTRCVLDGEFSLVNGGRGRGLLLGRIVWHG